MKLNKKFHLVYKTTTTPFFPICLVGKCFSGRMKELADGIKPKEIVALINDGAVNWFFDKSSKENAEKIFSNYYKGHFEKVRKWEQKRSKELLEEIKTPAKELFSGKKLNKKGKEKFQSIFKKYSDYARIIDIPGFLFQLYLSDKLKEEIFDKLDKTDEEKNEIFNFIISSYKKTNYERFLFAVSEGRNPKKIAGDFYWVIHDYLGEIIDLKYVQNKIKEFKRNKKEQELYLKGAIERIEKIKNIKKKLPKELLKKVEIIQEVLYLYNERKKEVLNKVNVYIRLIMKYKFPKYSISKLRELYQLDSDEIIKLLKGEKIKNLEKRNKFWGYYMKNEIISLAPKEYFSLIAPQKEIKVLKGIPASTGIVKGKVNVILNISHIYKFKEGDILVSPFTNVNYLPIMSKAKAILTETGGMTSHAAIVSREMKIPCVVGIKNLLMALRDGDYVEVNAEKGVVRKIK